MLQSLNVDRYVKKFQTIQLIMVLIYGQIFQQKSLPVLVSNFSNGQFCQSLGLESISVSQLSRRLNNLSPHVPYLLFQQLVLLLHEKVGMRLAVKQIGPLYLIDSSTITMCLTKYPWATYRTSKAGIKLHLKLKLWNNTVYPDTATLTCAKVSDSKELENLVVEDSDVMHVFDRGYIHYQRFDEYCKQGIRFTTRLKDSAIVETLSEKPVSSTIVRRDCIIRLGDGKTKMRHELRLIEVVDTQGNLLSIITNDFHTSAEEIAQIYRHRWQIELFFKWIKQHFSVKHFYATSPNAVENQIYIALITYCLLRLLKLKTGCSRSLLEMTRILTQCIFESYEAFAHKLCFKSSRTSKGRRKVDYQTDYLIVERLVFQVVDFTHIDDFAFESMN